MTHLSVLGVVVSSLLSPQEPPLAAGQRPAFELVQNGGQWQPEVRFRAQDGGMTLWALDTDLRVQAERPARGDEPALGVALSLRFAGGEGRWEADAADRTGVQRTWLVGNDPTRWASGVDSFHRARLREVYPGTDIVLAERDGVPCYDVELRPGADLARVVVRVAGHRGLRLDADGSLILDTDLGPFRQTPPRTWMAGPGDHRTDLASRFVVLDHDHFGFAVDGWDGSQGLVVDPGLIWGSFFGGALDDQLDCVALDSTGRVVTAGTTRSTTLPTTLGAYRPLGLGGVDAVVAVFASNGGALQTCTYYGGNGDDVVHSLQIIAQDRIVLGGATNSPNLAVSPNAFQNNRGGGWDTFAAIFNAQGTILDFGTYYGFGGDQTHGHVWADNNNLVYIAGRTNTNVAATANAFQNNLWGQADVFLATLNRANSPANLTYSSLYGGDADEQAVHSLHVDSNGIATIGVTSNSTTAPLSATPFQSTNPGGQSSGLIVCLQPSQAGQAGLIYASWFGGNGNDTDLRLELDPNGFFTAICNTTSTNWPTSLNAAMGSNPGQRSGLIARLNPGQSGLAAVLWMSYLGAGGDDELRAFVRDPGSGIVAICGSTTSTDLAVTTTAVQGAPHGGVSGLVLVVDPALGSGAIRYASYFDGCGGGDDRLHGVARTANGQITVVGSTAATTAPTTGGTFQTASMGAGEGIVARIDGNAGLQGFRTFGAGCGAAGFVPVMSPDLPPRMCSQFRVQMTGLRPNSVGVMFMGLSDTSWFGVPLPRDLGSMNMPGCQQLVSVEVTFVSFQGSGTDTFGFVTPANPLFYGMRFYLQYGMFDAAANGFGVALSNGGEGIVIY